MESKIINTGIILLYKYKEEKTEVISRLLFTFLLANYKIKYLHFPNTFSYFFYFFHDILEFRKYSSNHILKVCKAPNQSVVKNINMFF